MTTPAASHVVSLSPESRRFAEAACRAWLAIGLLLCAFVPAARDVQPLFGWLPFWLLLAPLLVLAQLDALDGFVRARRLAGALRRRVASPRRPRGQARRLSPASRGAIPSRRFVGLSR
jgi:hypothetical protein